jgi:hypothetical protein
MMQTFDWKSLSILDGSERTFLERLRSPDPNLPFLLRTIGIVLPFSFIFLAIPFVVFSSLAEAFLELNLG